MPHSSRFFAITHCYISFLVILSFENPRFPVHECSLALWHVLSVCRRRPHAQHGISEYRVCRLLPKSQRACVGITYLLTTDLQEQRPTQQGNLIKIPIIVPKYKMPHRPRRDGSWLMKAYRDVTGCAQSLSCRHSGLFPASTFTIFLLLAFFAAFYRFLQGQVTVDLDSGHKSKELARRETSF